MITIPIIESLKAAGIADGLHGTGFKYQEYMSVEEGNVLYEIVKAIRPKTVLEIGMGLGCGTLYMLQAMAENAIPGSRLVSVDPSREDCWTGVALKTIERSGLGHFHSFISGHSEYVLPELVKNGAKWEFAFIDSNHQFDQTMVELYFIEKALAIGGSVAFHDVNLISVTSACNFAQTNLGYALDPINLRKSTQEMGALKILTKTEQPERPWFHFIPFEVPQGDQMSAYLKLETSK